MLPKGATYGDALVLGVFKAAIEGRTDAEREIREAIEGKSWQRLELSAPENRETVIHVVCEGEIFPTRFYPNRVREPSLNL